MTTILIINNCVYSDSNNIDEHGSYISPTKIKKFKEPVPLSTLFSIPPDLEDMLYGCVSTGSITASNAMIAYLESYKESADVFKTYESIHDLGLINNTNLFKAYFIGVKFNYTFYVQPEGIVFDKVSKETNISDGSGGAEVKMHYGFDADPIRAMYRTLYGDQNSDGFVDCWELTKVGDNNHVFKRTALYQPIEKDLIPYIIDQDCKTEGSVLATFKMSYQGGNTSEKAIDKAVEEKIAIINDVVKARDKRYEEFSKAVEVAVSPQGVTNPKPTPAKRVTRSTKTTTIKNVTSNKKSTS